MPSARSCALGRQLSAAHSAHPTPSCCSSTRRAKPWISKDYDVVVSCISLLVGGILIFQVRRWGSGRAGRSPALLAMMRVV